MTWEYWWGFLFGAVTGAFLCFDVQQFIRNRKKITFVTATLIGGPWDGTKVWVPSCNKEYHIARMDEYGNATSDTAIYNRVSDTRYEYRESYHADR